MPQAKRRQNAQRLKQLNARRKGEENYGMMSQGRTRNAGRGGGMQGRGGRGGRGQWRDRIDRQASGETTDELLDCVFLYYIALWFLHLLCSSVGIICRSFIVIAVESFCVDRAQHDAVIHQTCPVCS